MERRATARHLEEHVDVVFADRHAESIAHPLGRNAGHGPHFSCAWRAVRETAGSSTAIARVQSNRRRSRRIAASPSLNGQRSLVEHDAPRVVDRVRAALICGHRHAGTITPRGGLRRRGGSFDDAIRTLHQHWGWRVQSVCGPHIDDQPELRRLSRPAAQRAWRLSGSCERGAARGS